MQIKSNFSEDIKLLHERDAAVVLACSIAWLQKCRHLRVGPRYIKIGGVNGRSVRYRLEDLQRYINDNAVETADSAKRNGGL